MASGIPDRVAIISTALALIPIAGLALGVYLWIRRLLKERRACQPQCCRSDAFMPCQRSSAQINGGQINGGKIL
jgi:hypothetical protein